MRFQFLVAALALVASSVTVNFAAAETALWGKSGEAWDPTGILPDFSFAGYKRGEQTIPERPPTVSVTDYGANPNSDATKAFQKAIEENPGKCIGIPAGRFELSNRISILTTGTVLRGEGPRETTLYFTRGLEEIEPSVKQKDDKQTVTKWSWDGGVISLGKHELNTSRKMSISGESKRGEYTIKVNDNAGLEAGQNVLIDVFDDTQGSLTSYLYRNNPGDVSLIKGRTHFSHIARIVSIKGAQVTLDRPLRTDIRLSWKPALRSFVPQVEDCGLEGLTIEFPSRPYRGHFKEDGLNGVIIKGMNNWVRNIAIRNADSGVYLRGHFHTVDGVTMSADRQPGPRGNTGHHGLTSSANDCLITNFNINTKFFHDLTVTNLGMGNVFSEGRGTDLCLDHHRNAPYENLFTKIHLGKGTRPWSSGGAPGTGHHTAAGATFWNIDSNSRITAPKEDFGPRDLIFVGLNARDTGVDRAVVLPNGWYYEKQRPGNFEPANLHQAQLQQRLKTPSP